MKIDKYFVILGNIVGFYDMLILIDYCLVVSLFFGGKYCLIDFLFLSFVNVGVCSIFGIF